jgi:phosphoribosylformimino-5-aminoimidazole carboxamide ribotide isomerase
VDGPLFFTRERCDNACDERAMRVPQRSTRTNDRRLSGGWDIERSSVVIVIPAIDIRDGAGVQPAGGLRRGGRLERVDPVELAMSWTALGFSRLHVTDLDDAAGRGNNTPVVDTLLHRVDAAIQVSGDVRTTTDVDRLLQAGADRVVVGARAIEDLQWLEDVASQGPGRVAVATLVRDRHVVTRDRGRALPRDILSIVEDLNELPVAAVIVTVAQRDRWVEGTDLFLMEDLTEASVHPVIAAGGITTMSELRDLDERDVSAAIVGWALYTGRLDPRVLADEFALR